MKCNLCKAELTSAEVFTYSGKCEVCWSGIVQKLPKGQILGREETKIVVKSKPDGHNDRSSHSRFLGKKKLKYHFTDPIEDLEKILVPEEVMCCVVKARVVLQIRKLKEQQGLNNEKLSLLADADEVNVARAVRAESKVGLPFLFRILIALGGKLEDICAVSKCQRDEEHFSGVKLNGWKP